MAEEKDEAELVQMVTELRNSFNEEPLSFEWRMQQLSQLEKMIEEHQNELISACQAHLGVLDNTHNFGMRLWLILRDIREMQNSLSDLMKPKKIPLEFPYRMAWSSQKVAQPRGVCLIIAPWNFPIQLLLRPLIGAIAAGNAVILKPSEVTDTVASLLFKLVPEYLDQKYIRCVTGGPATVQTLIKQKLDFVMFTGGTSIGSKIMTACAENVTECLLELGGKNPVFIGDDADVKIAATRTAQGRFNFNSGQVCLCPEYVFISKGKVNQFVDTIKEKLQEWHASDAGSDMSKSKFFGTIVSDNHFQRLMKIRNVYIGDSASEEERKKVLMGTEDWLGKPNSDTRYMPPMIVQCDPDNFDSDEIMKGEVFGPFLTIIPMEGSSDTWNKIAVDKVRSTMWKPLACYAFSADKSFIQYINTRVSAGAFAVNSTVGQMALPGVPFGGTGLSGFGHYGGTDSFDTFSHMKPFSYRSPGLEFVEKRQYPSNGGNIEKDLRSLIPARKPSTMVRVAQVAGVIGIIGLLAYKFRENQYVKPVLTQAASYIPTLK